MTTTSNPEANAPRAEEDEFIGVGGGDNYLPEMLANLQKLGDFRRRQPTFLSQSNSDRS